MKLFVMILIVLTFVIAFAPFVFADVSFNKDVRPIFQRHCTECHSGSVDYATAVGYKEKLMNKVVRLNAMPPKYVSERLSSAEIATIKEWLLTGTKE